MKISLTVLYAKQFRFTAQHNLSAGIEIPMRHQESYYTRTYIESVSAYTK